MMQKENLVFYVLVKQLQYLYKINQDIDVIKRHLRLNSGGMPAKTHDKDVEDLIQIMEKLKREEK
jgi:hypothetical protein